MIIREINLNVDFEDGLSYTPFYTIKNDSNTYKLNLIFVQDVTDLTCKISFKLPDESKYITDVTIIDFQSGELILPDDILSEVGKVDCQLSIHDLTTDRLTHIDNFYFIVNEDLSENAVEI